MRIVTLEQYTEEKEQQTAVQTTNFEFDRTVLGIIETVREDGDQALRNLTEQFDGVWLDNLIVTPEEFAEAQTLITGQFLSALRKAKQNITTFHEVQKEQSWFINQEQGIVLGQKVTPLDSVGIYVPGGKAAYPSTVLMNAIPADRKSVV